MRKVVLIWPGEFDGQIKKTLFLRLLLELKKSFLETSILFQLVRLHSTDFM